MKRCMRDYETGLQLLTPPLCVCHRDSRLRLLHVWLKLMHLENKIGQKSEFKSNFILTAFSAMLDQHTVNSF